MLRMAEVAVAVTASNVNYNGAGVNYLVQTPSGVLYLVFVDINSDVAFVKSTDGGLTWGSNTVVFAGTVTALSVWYDRWSNINAGLIHIAYQESGTDDTLYRTINTESSDALSTQTVIFAGTSTAASGWLSITRAQGGNVYCSTVIDAGVEGGFFRLPNANVPNGLWDAARANLEALALQDQVILVPGFAADTQDIMAVFWDASANQISRYIYDDSLNTWAETIFTGTFTDGIATSGFPHFAAAVDLANSQILVVAWTAVDLVNAVLTCWTMTESAITAKTDVVTNSTDDQGLAAMCLDTLTGIWWVYYCGASGGGETWPTSMKIYCKASSDSGSTWGPETKITELQVERRAIFTIPRVLLSIGTPPPVATVTHQLINHVKVNAVREMSHAKCFVGF